MEQPFYRRESFRHFRHAPKQIKVTKQFVLQNRLAIFVPDIAGGDKQAVPADHFHQKRPQRRVTFASVHALPKCATAIVLAVRRIFDAAPLDGLGGGNSRPAHRSRASYPRCRCVRFPAPTHPRKPTSSTPSCPTAVPATYATTSTHNRRRRANYSSRRIQMQGSKTREIASSLIAVPIDEPASPVAVEMPRVGADELAVAFAKDVLPIVHSCALNKGRILITGRTVGYGKRALPAGLDH